MSHIFVKSKQINQLLCRHIFHRKVQTSSKLSYTKQDDRFCVVPSNQNLDPILGLTIPEFFWSNLQKWENATAFECGVTGRKYTHLEIYKQSQSFAAALKQHGLKKNDCVAVLLPNIPEYAAVILGILEGGIIASPFNPTYTARELPFLPISIIECT